MTTQFPGFACSYDWAILYGYTVQYQWTGTEASRIQTSKSRVTSRDRKTYASSRTAVSFQTTYTTREAVELIQTLRNTNSRARSGDRAMSP